MQWNFEPNLKQRDAVAGQQRIDAMCQKPTSKPMNVDESSS
jgi:hypothetical protein